jgi:uncharacterized protein (DUF302 family)
MNYHHSKKLSNTSFEEAIERITEELQKEGFGILTEVDVTGTFKKKLDINFRNYRILGACNPNYAYKAISSEDKIGVFLPCSIVVQEHENGEVEVSAVDPMASMMSVENDSLEDIATEVQEKLRKAVNSL